MDQDQRYECALSAALVILGEIDDMPGMAKHKRLALVVFSILHAMDRSEEERGGLHVGFSLNSPPHARNGGAAGRAMPSRYPGMPA